jgi:hypothetical protein
MRFVPHEAHNLTAIILLLLLHLTFNRGSNYNIYDAVCCFCGVVMCLCYCCVCYMYRLTYNIIIDSSESKPKYLHIIGNTTTVNVLLLCVLCSATSATSARRRVTRQGAFLSTPFGPSASAGREEIDR